MLNNLKEDFKNIFGVECKESFFATARKNFLSEDSTSDTDLAYGTFAAASERVDGMFSICIEGKVWTLPLDSIGAEKELEFISSVIDAYKSCGYSINKGMNLFLHKEVPNEESYSLTESMTYIVAQAFNRIEGFGADSVRISKMAY